jgi:predicted transcriptional regulator
MLDRRAPLSPYNGRANAESGDALMASLGELERAVMDLLWAGQEAATANRLRDLLAQDSAAADGNAGHQGKDLAVTTVLTVLSRLEKKGLVERERGTRPHRYQAVSSRADHTADLMHEALGSAPDREAVLARFIGSVSESEAATLRKLLGKN